MSKTRTRLRKPYRGREFFYRDPRPVRQLSTCAVCGKRSYGSKRDAKADGRRLFPGSLMRVYQCGQWWHLTSQPTEVTAKQREYRARPRVPGDA